MPFNLSHVVLHLGYVQTFTVLRSVGGDWVNGRWVEATPTTITMNGVVEVAQEKDLRALPEGDRVQGMMVFHSPSQMYVTRGGTDQGTSDIVVWKGQQWRLKSVWDYSDYGFYKAIGERIIGE